MASIFYIAFYFLEGGYCVKCTLRHFLKCWLYRKIKLMEFESSLTRIFNI